MKSWQQLERLSASFNKLKVLPVTIGCCQKLTELDLCNNLLDEIPPELAMCRGLQVISLLYITIDHRPDCYLTLP